MAAVILVRLPTLPEAQILRGLLQSHGIPAFIPAERHFGNDSLSWAAFNGAAVMVPASATSQAGSIISEVRAEVLLEDHQPPTEHGRHWRATAALACLYAFPMAIALLFLSPQAVFYAVPGHYALETTNSFPDRNRYRIPDELQGGEMRVLRPGDPGPSWLEPRQFQLPIGFTLAFWAINIGLLVAVGRDGTQTDFRGDTTR